MGADTAFQVNGVRCRVHCRTPQRSELFDVVETFPCLHACWKLGAESLLKLWQSITVSFSEGSNHSVTELAAGCRELGWWGVGGHRQG